MKTKSVPKAVRSENARLLHFKTGSGSHGPSYKQHRANAKAKFKALVLSGKAFGNESGSDCFSQRCLFGAL